jgi:hypothetical protein
MKRLIIILSVALCLFTQAQAQRYLPGQAGVQFTAGTVNGFNLKPKSNNFAYHAGFAFSVFTKNTNRWAFGGEYLEKRHPYKGLKIPQSQFTAEAGFYLNFLSDRSKTVFFSLGISALGGYETVNWKKKVLFDGATIENKNGFLYGGALTFETEIFVSNWFAFLINVRERVLGGSSIGLFNTQIGVGIKFILN